MSGFAPDQIDQIILGDDLDVVEKGELEPPGAVATSRLGDVYACGPHRVICGSSTDPKTFQTLMAGDPLARFVLTDVPYNVKIEGNVSGLGKNKHREFAMASGEMSDDEFIQFNVDWMNAVIPQLCDGGVLGA